MTTALARQLAVCFAVLLLVAAAWCLIAAVVLCSFLISDLTSNRLGLPLSAVFSGVIVGAYTLAAAIYLWRRW